jgi:hypothetical protein
VIDRIAMREGITLNVVIDSDSLTAISQLVRSEYMTIMPHFAFADEIVRGEKMRCRSSIETAKIGHL